jgi:3-methyladenine DNA glycosylase AlkD
MKELCDNKQIFMDEHQQIINELRALYTEEKRTVLPKFFKTGRGQYGEGDKFIGVTVPNIRAVAKAHLDVSEETIGSLIHSEWHEVRMCALLIIVEEFKSTNKRIFTAEQRESVRKKIFDFYLQHTSGINNWDLVDLTAPTIVGEYLVGKPHDVLYRLAGSTSLWEQRIAVVATLTFIRNHDFDDIYALAEKFLCHPHDLMHKAVGWMLREAGKRDKARLEKFLEKFSTAMPRTMLRYSIEHFTPEERRHWMRR